MAAAATKADGTAFGAGDVLAVGSVVKIKDTADHVFNDHNYQFAEVTIDPNAFDTESTFEVVSMGTSDGKVATANSDAKAIADATTIDADFVKGAQFKVDVTDVAQLARLNIPPRLIPNRYNAPAVVFETPRESMTGRTMVPTIITAPRPPRVEKSRAVTKVKIIASI